MKYAILFTLTFIAIHAGAQVYDTVYFDQNLDLAGAKKTDIYRLVELDAAGNYNSRFKDFEKGSLTAEGKYSHGKKEGEFVIYNSLGEETVIGHYSNNKPVDNWHYYTDSKLKQLVSITDSGVVFLKYLNQQGEGLDETGTGEYILEVSGVIIKGKIKNYFMEGKWIKKYKDVGVRDVEKFRKGKFKNGQRIDGSRIPFLFLESKILQDIIFCYYFQKTEYRVPRSSLSLPHTDCEDVPDPEIDEEEEIVEEIFFIVEEMPSFQGGGKEKFIEYIAKNLKYPEVAAKRGISGRVFVQFRVNKLGCVDRVEIIRGVHPSLDMEALRVVASSPKWVPGKQVGRAVNVQFTFPIAFVLQ